MLHPIVEEIWTTEDDPKLAKRTRIRDAKDGWNAAFERAVELASRFDIWDFVHGVEYSYAWGRNEKSKKVHRFIVK